MLKHYFKKKVLNVRGKKIFLEHKRILKLEDTIESTYTSISKFHCYLEVVMRKRGKRRGRNWVWVEEGRWRTIFFRCSLSGDGESQARLVMAFPTVLRKELRCKGSKLKYSAPSWVHWGQELSWVGLRLEKPGSKRLIKTCFKLFLPKASNFVCVSRATDTLRGQT